jgi:hypothetical protein
MATSTRWLTGVLVALCGAAGLANATEQTLLGNSFTVKNPTGANAKRAIVAVAKEKPSDNTLVGDPTLSGSAGGAILQVFADGDAPSAQTFVLPQGVDGAGKPFWKATGTTGYQYKDAKGANGPVKVAQLKRAPSGLFQIKIVISGKNGAVDVVPPNLGTSGCFALQIGQNGVSGDRYSAEFGPTSQIKNGGTKLFKASKPSAEGACPQPTPPSTTTTTTTTVEETTTTTTTTTTEPTTTTTTTTIEEPTTTTTTTTTTSTAPAGVDVDSPVITTSGCLTNGSGAQLAVAVTLFDTNADPLTGATVMMSSTAGTLGPVQAAGNVYWAILTAPESGSTAEVTIVANGQQLTTQPIVTLADGLTDTIGGAGGCPQDGNLRVRVVDEEGAPIAGASVLVGQSELTNVLVTTFGAAPDGATTATTDALGYAVFRDFGGTLSGPITVTAGAPGRQYLTFEAVDASDVVAPLKPVVTVQQTGTLSGDVASITATGNVEIGVVLGDVTLDTLASFNLSSLLADNACYNGGSLVGNVAVPNNVFIPSQTILIIGIPKKPYVSAPLPFGQRHVVTLGGNVPAAALTGGGGVAGALTQLAFTNITAQTLNIAAPGPTPNNVTVSSYNATTACTASGAPATDAFCIAAMDWDGVSGPTRTVGEGPLGVFSFKAATASGGNVNITGVNYKSRTAVAPNPFTTVGHLGATVSLYLDKTAPTIPAGTANGVSVVLKRDFPDDALPSSFNYGAMYPIRVQSQGGRTLILDTPAGVESAQYVKHTLSQEISTAYTACAANDSSHVVTNPLWEVYAPAGAAAVTLPSLPASFPRATLGGNLAGLIDPDATPENDRIVWSSTTIREGLNAGFDYDQLSLRGFRKYGTNFTTNSGVYLP